MPKKSQVDAAPQKPKRLSKGLSEEGLIEIKIKLRKRTITVSEASGFQSGLRGQLLADLLDEYDGKEKTEAAVAMNLLMNFWAPLYACSSGNVPDRDQFLKMAETDISYWVETAKELNPDWFSWMNELIEPTPEQELEQEKKE